MLVGVGLFYEDGPILRFEGDDASGSLDLSPFDGVEIQVLAFHLAPSHRPADQRGLGSCYWREDCPFGHHLYPHRMLTFRETGVLTRSGDSWKVGEVPFPLSYLPGHRCIVAAVPVRWNPITPEGVNLEGLEQLRVALDQLKVR